MEFVELVVQFPLLVGIQFMFGDISHFLPAYPLIETNQRCKWGKILALFN